MFDQVAGIVGVSRLEQTPREAITRAIEVASSAGGRVLGMVATGAKLQGDYRYGYGYGETPQPAADPHFLAASGGQAGGPPVARKVRQFFPVRLTCGRCHRISASRPAGSRTASASRRCARRCPQAARRHDPSRQLLGGLCAAPGGPVGAIRSAAPPVRRRVARARASAGQLDPHTEGDVGPLLLVRRARALRSPLDQGNRILLARRAPGS